ncbi:MAG: acetate kinase [Chloroflexi bacterium]|nr:acetate kinase [Chloroflexota bacterium]
MKVLAINCGDSKLKFDLFDLSDENAPIGTETRLARGTVERVGFYGRIEFVAGETTCLTDEATVSDHSEATLRVLDWLTSTGLLDTEGLAVGHRVAHGGHRFVEPTLINDEVMEGINNLSVLASPLNEPSLKAIRAARLALGPSERMVAVFDTAFHHRMPEYASRYAIPWELAEKHRIRRYGFHGLAHRYMTERYAAITGTPLEKVRLVTLQLGNGCSASAVLGGRSVDTSMGFTPLEGMMMGARSGDADPSLVGFLARREEVGVKDVEEWLNARSGLLGISGLSEDMRELLKLEQDRDDRAALAIDMFCYRVRKYVGAYLAALSGADAIVFGGGIGENAPEIRSRVCAGMDWCGLKLDEARNAAAVGVEARISDADADIHVYVVPVDEAAVIARDAVICLNRQNVPLWLPKIR